MVASSCRKQSVVLYPWVGIYEEIVQLEEFLEALKRFHEGDYFETCSKCSQHCSDIRAGGCKVELASFQPQLVFQSDHRLTRVCIAHQNVVESGLNLGCINVEDYMQ